MKKLMGIPGEEGYSMPGEFEPHRGCIMIWPKRPGSWNYGAVKAREAFKNVAHAIAESGDPEDEYSPLVKRLGGQVLSYIISFNLA